MPETTWPADGTLKEHPGLCAGTPSQERCLQDTCPLPTHLASCPLAGAGCPSMAFSLTTPCMADAPWGSGERR